MGHYEMQLWHPSSRSPPRRNKPVTKLSNAAQDNVRGLAKQGSPRSSLPSCDADVIAVATAVAHGAPAREASAQCRRDRQHAEREEDAGQRREVEGPRR
mmetsp:Transcript_84083/g.236281  ORF Transcript_84083/g.236281 Transcript_84083/m.236281 type:complete len:99 (-) Transcript_84083:1577-1873(-)